MTPDPLDELLDRSAPVTRAADAADLRAMMNAASRQGRPSRRRVAIASGALALLLVGGAGVAVATDGFNWNPKLQDSVRAVSFRMESGFDCELRFAPMTGGADPTFVADANRVLDEWHRTTDVVAAARAHMDQTIADHTGITDAPMLEPGETWDTLPPGEAEHRRWGREWIVWELVVSDLESEELQRHGIDPADARFAGSAGMSQIQCFDENGEPYVPGAGS